MKVHDVVAFGTRYGFTVYVVPMLHVSASALVFSFASCKKVVLVRDKKCFCLVIHAIPLIKVERAIICFYYTTPLA